MALKAIAVNGSPRVGGNTEKLLSVALDVLKTGGVETTYAKVGGEIIRGCIACGKCRENMDGKCVLQGDIADELIPQIQQSDIIILGAPVYFGSAPAELKALIDRTGYVSRPLKLLERKLGGPVAVARRAGQNFTYAQLMYWYMVNGLIVPGSTYWNVGVAKGKGEIVDDKESLVTIENFAQNLLWLGKKLFS